MKEETDATDKSGLVPAEPAPEKNATAFPILHQDWSGRLSRLVKEEFSRGDIILVGVGHPLRADDYVGSLVAKDLTRKPGARSGVTIIDAENSPENILHILWNTKPRLVVVVDSIEAGLSPGSIVLVDLDQTTYPYFSTHNIPMKLLLEAAPGIRRTVLLGIQPASHEVGEPLSHEVENARSMVVRELLKLMEAVSSGLGTD